MRQRPNITEGRFDKWAEDLKLWITQNVSPFEHDTPAKQAERKQRAETDLLFFCETYLPHYFTCEFGDFHREWEELTTLRDEVVLVGAPREHAKSTFWSFAVPIRNLCYQTRLFQLIVSDTNDQATGFTLAIRAELEDNPRLRHDFGEMRGPTWKANDFTASNGVRILARGRGEKVRGLKNRQHRPDYASVDDFENDENVENPTLVTKGMRWLKRAVIGSMGTGFLFAMVSNLYNPKSVISQLIAEKDEQGEKLYLSRVYDCWLDFGKPEQRPLWPALWPAERLEKKRRTMSTTDFNAEMRNLCGAEGSPFPEDQAVYYDRQELYGKTLKIASFCDPSSSSGQSSDFKAVITVGLDPSTMIFYVLHAWIRHSKPGGMFAACYNQVDEYGGVMGIEENMLKDFLHEAIQSYAKEQGRFISWHAVQHSSNKEARIIATLEYLWEYGRIRFCKGHSDQDLLVEQMVYILNKNVNDDGPDALEAAVSMAQGATGFAHGSVDPERSRRLHAEASPKRGEDGEPVKVSLFGKRGAVGRALRNFMRGEAA